MAMNTKEAQTRCNQQYNKVPLAAHLSTLWLRSSFLLVLASTYGPTIHKNEPKQGTAVRSEHGLVPYM
jgi:hypothetical protein